MANNRFGQEADFLGSRIGGPIQHPIQQNSCGNAANLIGILANGR